MRTLIIYTSQTGFTKKYAEWMAERMDGDLLELKEAQKKETEYLHNVNGLGNDIEDNVFGAGADTEFSAPDTQAGRDVVGGIPPVIQAERLFIHGIRHPVAGPDLAVVGVAGELEIGQGDSGTIRNSRENSTESQFPLKG